METETTQKKKTKTIKTGQKVTLAEAPNEADIPKDLLDQWADVVGYSTAYKVLQNGSFPVAYHKACEIAMSLQAAKRNEALIACAEHKSAHLIPEIAVQMKNLATESANGKKDQ